jgi:hypothetical protein
MYGLRPLPSSARRSDQASGSGWKLMHTVGRAGEEDRVGCAGE